MNKDFQMVNPQKVISNVFSDLTEEPWVNWARVESWMLRGCIEGKCVCRVY